MKDYHMHTTFSDGQNTVQEMVETAIKYNIREIAVTDHVWRTSEWFEFYVVELGRLRNKYKDKIVIHTGFEAKAINLRGDIDANDFMIQNTTVQIGSIHRIPKGENTFFTREEVCLNKENAMNAWFESSVFMIRNPHVKIIGHPFLALLKYDICPSMKMIDELFFEAAMHGKKMEVSGRYPESNQVIFSFLQKNPKYAGTLSFGSDSHSVEELITIHNL